MAAYYNEIDPYAAQWLRNLIAAGHIAPGDVDVRSIVDVRPDDLAGYGQCHFFAGIGGWSVALRLAGWPDDRPVWTGSCPCQPFSAAGAGKAADDERHLWPRYFPLIAERRPAIVFGEQVEAAIGWGWLDLVFTDLEQEGYACGAAVLPACGVGAPHIRQRAWFIGVDNAISNGRSTVGNYYTEHERVIADANGSARVMANTDGGDASAAGLQRGWEHGQRAQDSGLGFLAHSESERFSGRERAAGERQRRIGLPLEPEQSAGRSCYANPWTGGEFIQCADGKARPTQSGIFPLAHGIPKRVGRLRAYGNAIVPQVAAEFIKATIG